MRPIIRIQELSKQYRIGEQLPLLTFREAVMGTLTHPFRRKPVGPPASAAIWALRNLTLDVAEGEVLGIIGPNGAGKTTLLRILSRITAPTRGRVELYGRFGSLMDVGTGFHSELTGRENIYLSGVILGMKRKAIDRTFDAIVEFSGLAKFLDSPLKRYSTGMWFRLAFAVAAHLDPDILFVDEVLAFGDAEFQKKCITRVGDIARQGRTVLLVTHQMNALQLLCTRAVLMERGSIVADGSPTEMFQRYIREISCDLLSERVWQPEERPGDAAFSLSALRVLDENGACRTSFLTNSPVFVEVEFDLVAPNASLCIGFDLLNSEGTIVLRSMHNDSAERSWPEIHIGHNRIRCRIPAELLNSGTYFIAPKVEYHTIEYLVNGRPEVSFAMQLGHAESPYWAWGDGKFPGVIAPKLQWTSAPPSDRYLSTQSPPEENS